jgi:CDGSH-type Zn-finger protein
MALPNMAQRGPYLVNVVAGKTYYWCACGLGRNQPFCDGSHKGTGLEPMAYAATETASVELCGCKHSGTKPFCDGAHENL